MRLAVVVPVYGNQASLQELYERIDASTQGLGLDLTIQFVNDGSPDESQSVLEELAARDPRVRALILSRNHGSFTAIMAGMAEVSDFDAVAVLSADLQDPPEKLPEMVAAWRAGAPVVLGVREKRSDPLLDRLLSRAFHVLYRRVVMRDMPPGGFDFFLIDRRVVEVINSSQEKNTSLVAMIIWSGFERAFVYYERAPRKHGRGLWTFRKKVNYAIDSVVSFSTFPVRSLSLAGVALAALALAWAAVLVISAAFGATLPLSLGSGLMILTLLGIGSVQLVGTGVLGEYLLNNLQQTRQRPLFVVDHRVGGAKPEPAAEAALIPPFNLDRVSAPVQAELRAAAERVLFSQRVVLGPEVEAFEAELAAWLGAPHVVGVASGTDAITLALWAAGVKPGDRVLTTALSAPPTAVAILRAGATPVFVDVDPETLLIDLEQASELAQGARAILPVHLYGNTCDMDPIHAFAEAQGMVVVEDCAQSLGSEVGGVRCGERSFASAYSFYPTKNLGCYGDGGAIALHDAEAAERLRRMRFYGQDAAGECLDQGFNSRLDELQAALLRARLPVLEAQNRERQEQAARYDAALGALKPVPSRPGRVPHLYVVRPTDRPGLKEALASRGVLTGCHYPLALNRHTFLREHAGEGSAAEAPHAEQAAERVLSLPCYPGLPAAEVERVIEACLEWVAGSSKA